jgi:hypothetical protein
MPGAGHLTQEQFDAKFKLLLEALKEGKNYRDALKAATLGFYTVKNYMTERQQHELRRVKSTMER